MRNKSHLEKPVNTTAVLEHALGGENHTADTLANLNTKVSDATLIDTADSRLSDARTPTSHATSHVTGGADIVANAIAAGNSGLMSGADKTKLDGIEAGAEKGTTVVADSAAKAALSPSVGELAFQTDETATYICISV